MFIYYVANVQISHLFVLYGFHNVHYFFCLISFLFLVFVYLVFAYENFGINTCRKLHKIFWAKYVSKSDIFWANSGECCHLKKDNGLVVGLVAHVYIMNETFKVL